MPTYVQIVEKGTAHPAIWLATAKPTEVSTTRRQESVPTVRRCTYPCRHTVCMYVHTVRDVYAPSVENDFLVRGSSRVTFVPTLVKNRSSVRPATSRLLTNLT